MGGTIVRMKTDKLDLIALTNAVSDKVYQVSEEFLRELGLTKGAEHRTEDPQGFSKKLEVTKPIYDNPAGSPANVAFSMAALGLETGILGTLGDDQEAALYVKKMREYDITDLTRKIAAKESGKGSGVCYTFITPDGERTFCSDMGVSGDLDFSGFREEAKIIQTSCYEIVGNEEIVLDYLRWQKERGAKISVDLADPNTCISIGEKMKEVLAVTDILFASPEEYTAAVGRGFVSYEDHPVNHEVIALKFGSKGSRIYTAEREIEIPIVPVASIVNTNGAGDSYAAGFLCNYLKSYDLKDCGNYGSEIASRVIREVGACLPEEYGSW